MPRKRSRVNTEQRFKDAVLELVGESGCANLGVNLVAQRAGSDKVLIYRYFGDLEGLLEQAADSRPWLPTAEELLASISGTPRHIIGELFKLVVHHVKSDPATFQLSRWRHAVQNPLTSQYTADWIRLWEDLPKSLSHGLSYEARQNWEKACGLLALAIQGEINGEGISLEALEDVIAPLEAANTTTAERDDREEEDDSLPTNLL